jgi:phosphoenolpyruvate-protein phosphotransferase/dihydroxyacetone kinase phosphotransfer subunit
MVGIVLVSHSRSLATAVQELVRSMTGDGLPLAIAAGAGENHAELGTDAVEISEAILSVKSPEGVLVLMDMGSAILSAETALDLLDENLRDNIRFCAAPFVEGAVASGVTANLGASLDEVCAEALAALKQKQAALDSNHPVEAEQSPAPAQEKNEPASPQEGERIRLTVRNFHGLHARPAAKLINETRPFHSEITVRNLSNQRGPVSVKSLSSLASLEILQDNEIEIAATGDDAVAALEKISRLIESGLGETLPSSNGGNGATPRPDRKIDPPRKTNSGPVPISSGIAIGPGVYFQSAKLEVPQHKAADVAVEINRLQTAIVAAQKSLQERQDRMSTTVGQANAGIYEAQILALQDPELTESAVRLIQDEKLNAALAWDCVNRQVVGRYESLHDAYLRERAADLEDAGRQVLELLTAKISAAPKLAEPGILVADALTPYQVSSLSAKLVLGVILLDGGPTAHASILLKALGIPAVVQARSIFPEADLSHLPTIALDGSTGQIWRNPDQGFLADLRSHQAEERKREQEERETCSLPAETRDGHQVDIFANIGDVSEIEAALQAGAEGVGLLRTEFLFLERNSAPTEEEQFHALSAIAEKMNGKPLIVRTLDVGGDKELPYLQMPAEENPFLGVRALRLCFANGHFFRTQLRAILRAGYDRDIRIMFPMVATITDLDRATACLEQVHRDLQTEQVPHLWPVQTGIMIEIPSAALEAEALARQADFFSIGTNDLTQYTLAADRGNPELASYQDALHPAVLRLIEIVVNGARKHNRLVAVCGEAASDERAAAVFVGLGVQELSLTSSKIPRIKASLRKQSLANLRLLAHSALHCHSAAEVRALKPAG